MSGKEGVGTIEPPTKDTGMSPVAVLIAVSNEGRGKGDTQPAATKPTPPPQPTPREINWTLKNPWTVRETITLEALVASVTAGPANLTLAAPTPALLSKGGVDVTVEVVAAAADGFAEARKSATVTVEKLATEIIWRDQLPVTKGALLTPTQLNATVEPPGPVPVYVPARNAPMNVVGSIKLTASFAGDDVYQAATSVDVTVQVVEAADLAKTQGVEMMRQGRAFAPLAPTSKAALDNYNNSDATDPTSMKGQATKIMADVKDKTGPELVAYMDTLVDLTTDPDQKKWINDKTPSGLDKEYPNVIWKLPNGMKVRYKPKGDGRDPTNLPQFMIEGMNTDCVDIKAGQETIAFKVMPDGTAAPKGPGDMVQLYDKNVDAQSATEYNDAACALTHLSTKRKPQVIAWVGDASLPADEDLDDRFYTVLGGAKATMTLDDDEVDTSVLLPLGAGQKVKIVTEPTEEYFAGNAEFDIDVVRRAQVITWADPPDIEIGATLAKEHLNATWLGGDQVGLVYRKEDGDVIAVGDVLASEGEFSPGDTQTLTAKTGRTGLYESNEVDVTITMIAPAPQEDAEEDDDEDAGSGGKKSGKTKSKAKAPTKGGRKGKSRSK